MLACDLMESNNSKNFPTQRMEQQLFARQEAKKEKQKRHLANAETSFEVFGTFSETIFFCGSRIVFLHH